MLILATHKVEAVSAKVAFSTIMLLDQIKMKNLPPGYKCRYIFPSSGKLSVSLWDGPDLDSLLEWLNANINVECEHDVLEVRIFCHVLEFTPLMLSLYSGTRLYDLYRLLQVQEEFAFGLGDIHRARATEKGIEGTKNIADRTAKAVQDFDSRMKISERAGHAVEAVKDSSVVQQTGAAFTKASSSVRQATVKVMEQPTVSHAAETVGTGFRKLTASLSGYISGTKTSAPVGENQEVPVSMKVDDVNTIEK